MRTETIRDIPKDCLSDVFDDYLCCGVKSVKTELQSNGRWTIIALFEDNATYQASGAKVF